MVTIKDKEIKVVKTSQELIELIKKKCLKNEVIILDEGGFYCQGMSSQSMEILNRAFKDIQERNKR